LKLPHTTSLRLSRIYIKTHRRAVRFLLFAFICLSVLSLGALAQRYRGSIRGHIADAQEAALPGATVIAKNLGTGVERNAMANDAGDFVLAELDAGRYQVTASATGLDSVTQIAVIDVGVDTNLNLVLSKVASISETVEIKEQAPLMDAASNTLSAVIEDRLVHDLPLNGRDFGKLVALTPGVAVEGSGVAGTEKGFGQFNVNGNRDRSNNYLLDGTDNNDPFFNNSALNQVGITGAPASLLPLDAIQEFNIQTSYGAEYGRNAGGVVNVITKSGTDKFHGAAFGYLRNNVFDARNYFNTKIDQNGNSSPQTPFRNTNFGGSIGGPVLHSKTFFFGAYEGQREAAGSDFQLTLPTLSQIAEARAIAQANGEPTINPGLDNVLNLFHATNSSTLNTAVQDKNNLDSFLVKVDHHLTEREEFTARYAFSQGKQQYPLGSLGGYGSGSRLQDFAQTSPTRVQVLSMSFLSVLKSNLINEVRIGYSRYHTSFTSLDATTIGDPTSIGLNTGTNQLGLPEFDFSGEFENLGATAYSVPRARTSQTFQPLDNLTWILGKHTFKFGFEYRYASVNGFNNNLERGLLYYGPGTVYDLNGDEIADQPTDPVVQTLANFYLGSSNYGGAYIGDTRRTTVNHGAGAFAQDSYKFLPTLSFDYGVRWEYFGPLSETHGLLANLGSDGLLAMSGSNGAYEKNWMNFAPRAGLSWQIDPLTVLRSGYGIYYDYTPQDELIANYTNVAGLTTEPIGSRPVLPLTFLQGSYASGSGPFYSADVSTTDNPVAYDIFVTPRHLPTPYAQSWNLNLERQLGRSASFELGYVGSKGTHLSRLYDANQPDSNGTRPNSTYGAMDTFAMIAWSNYHSLQATLHARGFHGLTGLATYNWAKSLDTASDGIDFNFASAALPQDSNNLKAEYGPSTFDIRQRFTAAVNYTLPILNFGSAWIRKQVGSGWELSAIASAQTGQPIPIVTSSDTTECADCYGSSNDSYHQRPNVVAGVKPILSRWSTTSGYLNPAAFSQPDYGTFGNLGRNAISGPKFVNFDLGLLKSFTLAGDVLFHLRVEAFNLFNHPNFALPSGSYGSSTFGTFSQTPDVAQGNPGLGGGGPRVLQISGRFTF
jgi:hypothetical protein